jgi:Flp pilus assembly protein TadD
LKRITLDFVVSPPLDATGRKAAGALALLRRGEQESATRLYREAKAAHPVEATTWSNLAVFALLRGDLAAASAHARLALRQAPRCADALVNFALVRFAQKRPVDARTLLQRAVEADPGHARARTNYAKLMLAAGECDEAEAQLHIAAEASPGDWRIPLERARVARARGDHAGVRSHALAAIGRAVAVLPPRLLATPRKPPHTVSRLGDALCAVGDLLRDAGQPFHLMAGTLLALVRDGELLGHDKDIDLALPWDCDREALVALFRASPGFAAPSGPIEDSRRWGFSVTHAPTHVGIDLFFLRHGADGVLAGVGASSLMLYSRVRPFGLGELEWRDRRWPIPSPPEQYLEDIYGPRWREPDPYFDTVLSNPSRTADSVPAAVGIGLQRLCNAMQARHWLLAHALCRQLLAREFLPEVAALDAALAQRLGQPA